MKKRVDKLATARLSKDLCDTIDDYVKSEEGQRLGYRSRADFLTKTAREHLERNTTRIEVPSEILGDVRRLIAGQKHGYRSVEEFVSDALRRRLEQLKPLA